MMINDQAEELRSLMLKSAVETSPDSSKVPRLVVLTGGKGGVGTSTLAVNLAASLARQGRRIILVDADARCGDILSLCLAEKTVPAECGGDDSTPVAKLETPADVQKSIIHGPAGLMLLTAPWARGVAQEWSSASLDRFARQLAGLGEHAEYVFVDSGNGTSVVAQSLWRFADQVLTVTTPDTVSVMDTYAVIKSLVDSRRTPRMLSLVNQTANPGVASDVFTRLQQSCQRFLGETLEFGGAVPLDTLLTVAGEARIPVVLNTPTCPAARAIERIAKGFVKRQETAFERTA
jgi:flagellar biosynthesis protein FlhG